jgi:hypothetical protein
VTFAATVSVGAAGGTPPSGTVTFVLDGVKQAPIPLNASGVANLVTSTLKLGAHTVRALFNGTASFLASNSPTTPLTHVVNLVTSTTSVIPSATDVPFGALLSFIATVTPDVGSAKPAGTVTFSVDGVKAVTLAINSAGQAVFNTASLAGGTHNITAVYNGGGNFAASPVSFPATVFVEPPLATALSASAASSSGPIGLAPFTITIKATDSHGNLATGYTGTVSLVLKSAPARGTLGGTLVGQFVNGVAVFPNLTFNEAGTFVIQIISGNLVTYITIVDNGRAS